VDIHLSNGRTIIHLFASLKCTLSKLVPSPYRTQIGFEPAVNIVKDGFATDIFLSFFASDAIFAADVFPKFISVY
jgi:hypothetical protein